MKNKTKSIKKVLFYEVLRNNLLFALVSIIFAAIFISYVGYVFISDSQNDFARVITSMITEREQEVVSITEKMASGIKDYDSLSGKQDFLENSVSSNPYILGAVILDNSGRVVNATGMCSKYIDYDLSGMSFYNKVLTSLKTEISDTYVFDLNGTTTYDVASPIISNGKLNGMIVSIINSDIINKKFLTSDAYYITNSKGQIMFRSSEKGIKFTGNIVNKDFLRRLSSVNRASFYKDDTNNRYVLETVRADDEHLTYVVVQYYPFENKIITSGIIISAIISAIFIEALGMIFTVKLSKIVNDFMDKFMRYIEKMKNGEYDVQPDNMQNYEEVNSVFKNFDRMAHKIRTREERLQAYNEELIAANDEIRNMYNTINKNEKDKKRQYISIIGTLLNLIEMKDEYTGGHSKSVTNYAIMIAKKLNEDYGMELDIEKVEVSAILHDIGKIGIEKDILNKPGRLTDEEYQTIKTHAFKGYSVIRNIESLKDESVIVKYHHERYDGKGYPEGIKGDNIPIEARIICVADSFDAMVSDRPYRKGMPIEAAIAELEKNKGTQFDPFIVDVFVDILRNKKLNFNHAHF